LEPLDLEFDLLLGLFEVLSFDCWLFLETLFEIVG